MKVLFITSKRDFKATPHFFHPVESPSDSSLPFIFGSAGTSEVRIRPRGLADNRQTAS